MKVIIIEDETPAANRLGKLLQTISGEIDIIEKLDSIATAVAYFQSAAQPDLIFMDIQLADGISFDIFSQVQIKTPVIFTTAFDQYTLKAFKVNSIDYLLKPIDQNELKLAVDKYYELYHKKPNDYPDKLMKMLADLNATKYKERLLVKRADE